jgi:predicted transcriptional regulator
MSAADAASTHLQGKNMNFKEFFSSNPLDLFPRVRKDDPITSFEAADSIKEVSAKHYKVIVECLQSNGPLGKDGIAKLTGLDGSQVSRRLNEMKVLGLITLTGKTVKSSSGRNEREWTV